MKTIRMTAISTEKARSRTQESAFQTLVRAREFRRTASGVGVGFSVILCYVIIDALIGGSVARPPNGGRCARGGTDPEVCPTSRANRARGSGRRLPLGRGR